MCLLTWLLQWCIYRSIVRQAIEMAVGEPPHSNVHPMRAIFMIPNSPAPTLPDPAEYSHEFNDFLRVCLQKDPAKRPDAKTLLKTHPFVAKKAAARKTVIQKLVEECMPMIEEYRENEAKEMDESNGTIDSDFGTARDTMLGRGTSTNSLLNSIGDGTMRQAANAASQRQTGPAVPVPADDGFGTMVVRDSDNNNNTAAPSFMSHFRSDDDDAKVTKGAGSGARNAAASGGGLGAGYVAADPGDADVSSEHSLFRSNKKLDVSPNSSVMELQQALITLNKAYDEESTALDRFYDLRRQELQQMLAAARARKN
eukprot:TRINITY_DN66105_c12_g2_i1.p1 TRINITY_DN66105_c12_g2~~TRINITY_DN66105_c12_g2_i1.p1  ORF type:complete len:312 (-),score=163.62 TRINITY_DN66105_c12_g2_i1:156-1091(-)